MYLPVLINTEYQEKYNQYFCTVALFGMGHSKNVVGLKVSQTSVFFAVLEKNFHQLNYQYGTYRKIQIRIRNEYGSLWKYFAPVCQCQLTY